MDQLSIMLASLLSVQITALKVVDFSYSKQDWWFTHPEHCDSSIFPIQSPIELSTSGPSEVSKMPLVTLEGFDEPQEVLLFNDGTALVLKLSPSSNKSRPTVQSGPFSPGSQFELDHVVWHWGHNSSIGSEHVIDGGRAPVEMQMIFFNQDKFEGLEEALEEEEGVVVLAFLFALSEMDNPDYDFLTPSLKSMPGTKLKQPGSYLNLAEFQLQRLFQGVDLSEFFTYHGSLTRPPCDNTVTWVVFTDRVAISETQIRSLRLLKGLSGEAIERNYRELQPLAGRVPQFRPGSK